MDAELFQNHPELREGAFEAAYLGAGTILVRPRSIARKRASADVDHVMAAYLAWTEQVMTAQPELLRPMTAREFQLAEGLVAGVEVDLENDRLPDDFDLP